MIDDQNEGIETIASNVDSSHDAASRGLKELGYEVISPIAAGAFSTIYRCRCVETRDEVAVNVKSLDLTKGPYTCYTYTHVHTYLHAGRCEEPGPDKGASGRVE